MEGYKAALSLTKWSMLQPLLYGLPTSSVGQGQHIVRQASDEKTEHITACLAHDVLTVTTRRYG
jgi:hypothetical protein